MTREFIDGLFEIGHWINENFIVRLYAVLESGGVVGEQIKIRQDLAAWEELDITRRMRRQIAHGSAGYDPNDPEGRKLYERIVTHFKVGADYSYLEVEKYPIGVARVLVPLADGCKSYAVAFLG